MAAFMATAHAKLTGELGVCLSTGGPGATHLLTGLYDARMDHVPVLAIVGQAETTSRGASYQQELNLDRLFADVAAFVQEAAVPAQVRHVLDRGIRVALARNAVAAVILPKDVQDAPWEAPAVAHGFTRSGVGYQSPRVVPQVAELARAVRRRRLSTWRTYWGRAWPRRCSAKMCCRTICRLLPAPLVCSVRGRLRI